MIRRALGLGLMLLILKFLMNNTFVALESSSAQLLNTAGAVFSNIEQAQAPSATHLIPQ